MGSRLLPLGLVLATLAAGAVGADGPALYLGLLLVPCAAAAAFVAISDALEGRRAMLRAVTNGLALTFAVVASAVRENATHGGGLPPLVSWSLTAALVAYAVPAVAWVLEPVRLPRPRPRPGRVRVEPTP